MIVALEEMGLDYELHTVNVATNEQSKPEFLAINLMARFLQLLILRVQVVPSYLLMKS